MPRIIPSGAQVSLPRGRRNRRVDARCRPCLEWLEDRTAPAILSQFAHVDGYVADANLDGVFDTVSTTGSVLQTSLIPTSGPTTDQSNTATPWTNYNTSASSNLPLGQEFRPTQSSLSYVDLRLADAGSDIGPGANFQVRIRSGTITGAVLATSTTTLVPDGTNTGGGSTYTRFNFASAVSLTPGATYVIEPVQLTTGTPGVANFMWTADQSGTETYSAGRAIIDGVASTTGVDFLFREGSNGQPGVTERAVMEFDTSPIVAGSVINAVNLTGSISTLQPLQTGGVTAVFRMYTGDGLITAADATAASSTSVNLVNPALGQFQVDFSASAVQSLIQSPGYNGHLGVYVQLSTGQRIFLTSTENPTALPPKLNIVYNSDNLLPTAVNDTYVLNEGQTQFISPAPGVLGNDTDPDGDALTAVLVTQGRLGSVALAADGSFVYTRFLGAGGTSDTFTYRANDGEFNSNLATVTIRFNRPPVAFNRSLVATTNTTLNVAAPGILANNYDPDFDPLTAVLVSGTSHGALTLNANGSLTYIPDAGYFGSDQFVYQVSDGNLLSNTATVSILVNALPVAQNDDYSVDQDTVLSVPAPGLLSNDSDANGHALVAYLVTNPTHGSLGWTGSGSFLYTPTPGYYGSDSFTYRVTDGFAFSSPATVNITVNHVNLAPVAANDAYGVAEDQTLTVSLVTAGVLNNDSDSDGDALRALLVAGPTNGALDLNQDGTFSYTPNPNFHGTDSFTYKANDGNLDSNIVTATITVTPVNDVPVAHAGADQTVGEGAVVSFNGLASSDLDGDALSYSWDFGDGNTANGATPSHAFADDGDYIVTLTVSDGNGGFDDDTMLVRVNNVAPTASVDGPSSGVRGQPRAFIFGASDPSPVDQAASFSFAIAWGDGATQIVNGPVGQQMDHTYTATGTFTVQVTATDRNGGISLVEQHVIIIRAVDVQGTTLAVGGTLAGDNIVIKPANNSGSLNVSINGVDQGNYAAPAQLLVYGQAGNDSIVLDSARISRVNYYVAVPAVLFGGDGADTLDARNAIANNILVGGNGDDAIKGGAGRDILIGGLGADNVQGNGGDDVVIGGVTSFDANLNALLALLSEWARTDADYPTRVDHLSGATSGGLNGSYFLNPTTVSDDTAEDRLFGHAGLDWFFARTAGSNRDKINDLGAGEEVTVV